VFRWRGVWLPTDVPAGDVLRLYRDGLVEPVETVELVEAVD